MIPPLLVWIGGGLLFLFLTAFLAAYRGFFGEIGTQIAQTVLERIGISQPNNGSSHPILEISFDENRDLQVYSVADSSVVTNDLSISTDEESWSENDYSGSISSSPPPEGISPQMPQESTVIRKFATVHVQNRGGSRANECLGALRVEDTPDGVDHLRGPYHVHWADVDYSLRTSGAQPVQLAGGETRRLDIVFTQEGQEREGAWIAIPIALANPIFANQTFLPPGEYLFDLEVSCENGEGDGIRLHADVGESWSDLKVTTFDCNPS